MLGRKGGRGAEGKERESGGEADRDADMCNATCCWKAE